MRNRFFLILGIVFLISGGLRAEETPAEKELQLIIEPSSTKMSLATCNLIVSPLAFKEEAYHGSYKIKVSPFVFKNDQGSLLLAFSDENVRRMASGKAVEFTGKAVSGRDSKVKLIKGKTKPVADDRGAVAFTVATEDGDLLFNSTYHFAAK